MKTITNGELMFMNQTIFALLSTGARIGKEHYSVTITRTALWDLYDKTTKELVERGLQVEIK